MVMLKAFTNFSLRNPVAIVLLVILIAVGGVYATTKFNQEQLPEVSFPGIMVQAIYPGAAPNEVLTEVTLPLEKILRNVEGVKSVTSQSANSVSFLQLEFSYSDDMKEKKGVVEDALANVRLPQEVERPEVMFFSTSSQPIMYTTVQAAHGVTTEQLGQYVQQTLLPELQGIEGVTDVQVSGLKDNGLYIQLDAAKMSERGISYDLVMMTLQMNNLSIPLGEVTVEKSNLPVFVQGGVNSLDGLLGLVIDPMNGVKLSDIATVTQGKDADVISTTNGVPSVVINIVKSSVSNTVAVSDQVLSIYEEAQQNGHIESLIMYNRATDVKESVSTLAREGALGALFASILILFFLRNFRATLIAIVSIPLSMLIALICLKYFTDVTLNIMTLGGLAVATGRVVDDSIVVIENIVRRLQKERISRELILSGTMEVGRAITSSTLTTVAVFAPLGLLQGMTGEFFRPFALTVGFALFGSLVVALTVVPLMAWGLMKKNAPRDHGESKMSRGYKRVLNWSLGHKAMVLTLATLLFIGSLVPIFAGAIGVVFLPETDYKYLFAELKLPAGTDVNEVQAAADPVDQVIRGHKAVDNSNLTIGGSMYGDNNTALASWFIGLASDTDLDAFIDEVNALVNLPVDAQFNLIKDDMSGGGGIAVTVTGPTMADIRAGAEQVMDAIRGIEGTDQISSNLQDGTKGIAIEVRQEDAAQYGLSAAGASAMLRPFLTESRAGRLTDGASQVDLYMSLSDGSLEAVADIAALPLNTPVGAMVTVGDIADVREVQLPSALQLKNGAEFATVSAKITSKEVSKVNAELRETLAGLKLPDGVTYSLGGSDEDISQMLGDMMLAMLIAVGMVYIVMVIAFREGRAPLAVLFSLPFALIGGLAGTLFAGEPISISSLIGFLMLIGIVVTNAIVLVERVQQQLEGGATIREALIEAGGTRLRPILMTAIATICALTPLAIGLGGGSIISSGLAVVVIGGLASSTLLTLVVVPVMYELLYYKRARMQRLEQIVGLQESVA